jgi:hypothetical protein
LLAELLIAASAALATAGHAKTATCACTWDVGALAPIAFGDYAGSAAYQLFHRAAAFRARLDIGFGHLLSPLESAVT